MASSTSTNRAAEGDSTVATDAAAEAYLSPLADFLITLGCVFALVATITVLL